MSDIGDEFLAATENKTKSMDVSEMEKFVSDANKEDPAVTATVPIEPLDPPKTTANLPNRLIPRRDSKNSVGRLPPPDNEKATKNVMRNAAEVPRGAFVGASAALDNALGWAINPLADWLNDNILDTRFTVDPPKTGMGNFTKSTAEFLTGFIPALRGMKVLGLGGAVAPTAAGAVAGFTTMNPSAARLGDLWKDMGLPQNILTDYMAHPPPSPSDLANGVKIGKENELESRFKNALEQAGIGYLTDGVLLAARTIRASKWFEGAKQSEEQILKAKYGEGRQLL
jgi:hypothetical protein